MISGKVGMCRESIGTRRNDAAPYAGRDDILGVRMDQQFQAALARELCRILEGWKGSEVTTVTALPSSREARVPRASAKIAHVAQTPFLHTRSRERLFARSSRR